MWKKCELPGGRIEEILKMIIIFLFNQEMKSPFVSIDSTLAICLALSNGKLAIVKQAINMKIIYICFFWNNLLCEWDQIKRLNERGHVGHWPCYLAAIQLTSWNRSAELTRDWPQMNEWDQFRPAENYQTESSWNSQNKTELNKWLLTSRN